MSFAIAGVTLGLVLLTDVRGIVVAAPFAALALAGAVRRPFVGTPVRVLLLTLPVFASYQLAPSVAQGGGPTLEQAFEAYVGDARHDPPRFLDAPPVETSGYSWGHSNLADLPGTVRWLVSAAPPPGRGVPQQTLPIRNVTLSTWVPALSVWGGVALLGLLPQWRNTLALTVTVAPILLALHQALGILPFYRFVQGGMLATPLLLGVACGVLAGADGGRRVAAAVVVVLALLAGWPPSVLRLPLEGQPKAGSGTPWQALIERNGGANKYCREALAEDRAAGIDPGVVRVFGVDLRAPLVERHPPAAPVR